MRNDGKQVKNRGRVGPRRHLRTQALRKHHQFDPHGLKSDKIVRRLRLLRKRGSLHQASRGKQGDLTDRRGRDVQARLPRVLLQGIGKQEET